VLRKPAQFEQFQSERFELGNDAVHRGLVLEATPQQRILAPRPSGQGRERPQHRGPEVAAHTDLVVPRSWDWARSYGR